MKASNLRVPKYNKQELENAKAVSIYNKYKYNLESANENKEYYLKLKSRLKEGIEDEKLNRAIAQLKELAIEYWNKSQEYKKEYEDFEKNRKYPNK
jgi:hypothetical protein